jgi:hypothetical protein
MSYFTHCWCCKIVCDDSDSDSDNDRDDDTDNDTVDSEVTAQYVHLVRAADSTEVQTIGKTIKIVPLYVRTERSL